MRAYSQDIRDRVIAAKSEGLGTSDVAGALRVSRRYVDRVWDRYRQSGSKTVRQIGGYRMPRLEKHEALLRTWVEKEPGLTLEQMCQRYLKEQGETVASSVMHRQLRRMGLRFKKNAACQRADPQ